MHTCPENHQWCLAAGWMCVSVCFPFLLGRKRQAKQESTINMLIYAASSSFHYAYNHHGSRVCSPLFLMYECLSCVEQGQNQQSRVDLCSSWFPAAIVHQGRILTPFTRQKWLLLWLWLKKIQLVSSTNHSNGHQLVIVFQCFLECSSNFWPLVSKPPICRSQTVNLWLML